MTAPISEFTSHVDGRNSVVSIYADRIEWRKKSVIGRGDTNMIPVRQIQGVATKRSGLRYTHVEVKTAADTIAFRVEASKAEAIKTTIIELTL